MDDGAACCVACGRTQGTESDAQSKARAEAVRSLAALVQEAARNEYADALETWKLTDGKAQMTLAVCGVFLAGLLQFTRDLSASTPVIDDLLLVAGVLLTVAAAGSGLWTIRMRGVKDPPSAAKVLEDARRLLEDGNQDPAAAIPHFIGDTAEGWIACSRELSNAIPDKQKWLGRAQALLMGGGSAVGALVVIRVARLFA